MLTVYAIAKIIKTLFIYIPAMTGKTFQKGILRQEGTQMTNNQTIIPPCFGVCSPHKIVSYPRSNSMHLLFNMINFIFQLIKYR